MKKWKGWTGWVSRRFLTGRRGGRGRLVFFFSVTLISIGVATLITILSVMNGLQQGYIRSILEIGSYHLRWSVLSDLNFENTQDNLGKITAVLRSDPQVALAVPFREGQTMLNGTRSRPVGALLRGVPESLYTDDPALARLMSIVDGSFNVSSGGVVLGDELAVSLGVAAGDRVTALDLGSEGISPEEVELEVTGVFQCDYREYESTLAFVSLETIEQLFGPGVPDIGIKLRRLEADRAVINRLESQAEVRDGTLTSWRVSNRSFFGALRTEKVMMLILLALIFVVVAVNIDHSLRRMATERVEDLSLLKAVGAAPADIRLLFLRQGLAIGGTGAAAGGFLGTLIGSNVDAILSAVRQFRFFISSITGMGGIPSGSAEAFFSRSEVMLSDVVLVLFLAVAISTVSSIRAASQAASQKPAEVLRSE